MKLPKISIIVATDEKGGIGKDNRIPWHIKKDLVNLKSLTQGKVVIMGKNTYRSMVYYYDKSGRDMPARQYLVLTKDKNPSSNRKNISFVYSLEDALQKAKESGEKEIFVIGGAHVFKEMIGLADRIYLTQVKGDFNCDTFFPDYSAFKTITCSEGDEEEGVKFTFKVLEK